MKYILICGVCKSSFESSWKHTVVCSDTCRNDRKKKISGKASYQEGVTSGTVGAITEMEVAAELMKEGWAVFRALSPACFGDLIAIKKGRTLVIEARTGYLYGRNNDKVSFPPYFKDGVNCFGIYLPATRQTLFFETDTKTPIAI